VAGGARHLSPLPGAEHGVDLGEVRQQLGSVPLRQAAGHDQPPEKAASLELRHARDRVARLAHRAAEKRAGVDHRDVGLGQVGHGTEAGSDHEAQHVLGVHRVLGTAERHEGEARRTAAP